MTLTATVHVFESFKNLLEYPGAVTFYHHQIVSSRFVMCGKFHMRLLVAVPWLLHLGLKCLLPLQFALIA